MAVADGGGMAGLAGQRGVVTGGCGPLGARIVERLSAAGARVIAVDLPGAVRAAGSGGAAPGVDFIDCDLLQPGGCDDVVQRVCGDGQRVDFLVNNAAFTGTAGMAGYVCPFEEQTDEAFDRAVELNLAVPFRLVRRFTPYLRGGRAPAIVNVSSIYGLVAPDPGLYVGTAMATPAGYAASKGGLVQLTRYLASELAPVIRVNCVAPGGIQREQPSQFIERYATRVPLGRMAREEEVADAVYWLLSPAASYITGHTLPVDGGWTTR